MAACDECHEVSVQRWEARNTGRQVCAMCIDQLYCAECMDHVNACGTRVQRNGIMYCETCANNIMEPTDDEIFEAYMGEFAVPINAQGGGWDNIPIGGQVWPDIPINDDIIPINGQGWDDFDIIPINGQGINDQNINDQNINIHNIYNIIYNINIINELD